MRVRGAREHNLKNVDLAIPRDALVVFTGVSGSGKSSLAFGTLYAEAQRRYLESVSPYARRLFHQMAVPEVDEIDGLPPAVALQQQRGSPTTRSSVGSVTTLSNLLRMLYSRAGDYPSGQPLLYAESFSPNTPEGACPQCHGLGRVYEVTEASMVPDPSLTIRERAIAAWPTAWGGQNQRENPHDARLRRGSSLARPAAKGPRLDSLHRGAARRAGLLRVRRRRGAPRLQGEDGAQLHGHVHQRAASRSAHLRPHAERVVEEARVAIHAQPRVSALPRQTAAARVARRHLRRPRHRGNLARAPQAVGRRSCAPTRTARRRRSKLAARAHPEKADGHPAHRRRPAGAGTWSCSISGWAT